MAYCSYMKRGRTIRIRVSEEESKRLDELRGDVSLSAFIRNKVFGGVLVVERPVPEIAASISDRTRDSRPTERSRAPLPTEEPKKRARHYTDTW